MPLSDSIFHPPYPPGTYFFSPLMKIDPHPMFASDSLRSSWANEDYFDSRGSNQSSEAKTTMEANFENFVISSKGDGYSSGTLAELKPLEPIDYFTGSPETSFGHADSLSNETISGQLYRGALISNTFLGYSGTPEPVSTTTSPLSSSISVKQEESDNFVGADDIDDLASMIGCTNTDASIPTQPITFNDQIEPSLPESSLTIEDWLMLDVNKNDLSDSAINSSLSPDLSPLELSSSQLSSTTTPSGEYLLPHQNIHQHVQQPIHSSLQALLAAGTNNNSGYIHGIQMPEDTYQKAQPILYNKLTQPQKETLTTLNSSLMKSDSLSVEIITIKIKMLFLTPPTQEIMQSRQQTTFSWRSTIIGIWTRLNWALLTQIYRPLN